jgi:hypothetical protein
MGSPYLVLRHCANFLHRLRKETGDQRYYAPMEKENISLLRLTIISCYRPFREWLQCALPCVHRSSPDNRTEVLLYDKMILLLDTWWVSFLYQTLEETQKNSFPGPP